MDKSFKYLNLLTAFFTIILLVSNIVSTKLIIVGPFTFDAGTLLFPLSYIFGDVLTEVYGYARTRRVIWAGFFMSLIAMLIFIVVCAWPGAPEWMNQDAYNLILGLTPRIIGASLIAYFAGEFANSYIMAKMKIHTQGKYLWLRTIGSTIVGEGIDTVLFVLIAFYGIYSPDLLILVLVSNYVFKVSIEVFFTPITYVFCRILKRREQEDYFDFETKFNPFLIK